MADVFKLECSLCGAKIKASRNMEGKTVTCPSCHQNAVVVSRSVDAVEEIKPIEIGDQVVVMTPLVPTEIPVSAPEAYIAPARKLISSSHILTSGIACCALLGLLIALIVIAETKPKQEFKAVQFDPRADQPVRRQS